MSDCRTPNSSKSSSASCCGSTDSAEAVRDQVRRGYAGIATASPNGTSTGNCCGGDGLMGRLSADELATRIGYDADQLARLPEGANLGLSCGNPAAIAALEPGRVVLDLGSGGGFDVFLAGPKVGPTGRAIGVDMTAEMLSKARANIAGYREASGLDNVEFRLGEIEHLPVADRSVDVVISNCVINLSPDKPQVWREIARVLRPGGWVAASDIMLFQPLPDEIRRMPEALVHCVGGAIVLDDYRAMMAEAGLEAIRLEPNPGYVQAMLEGGDTLFAKIDALLGENESPADYVTSVQVHARKPVRQDQQTACCG